jgi:hypothetical protein
MTYKVQGKTVTESLPTPADRKKAEREIAEFRHFEQLKRTFLEVNTQICRARSTAEEPASQKKKTTGACQNAAETPVPFRRR